jgi:hypothetical protein
MCVGSFLLSNPKVASNENYFTFMDERWGTRIFALEIIAPSETSV